MVRNLVVVVKLAEPAVSEMQGHFLAQPTLMTNAARRLCLSEWQAVTNLGNGS